MSHSKVVQLAQQYLSPLRQYLPPLLPTIIFFTCYHLVFYTEISSISNQISSVNNSSTANITSSPISKLDSALQQWLALFSSIFSYFLNYIFWSVCWAGIKFFLTSPTVEVILYNLIGTLSRKFLQMEPENFFIEG